MMKRTAIFMLTICLLFQLAVLPGYAQIRNPNTGAGSTPSSSSSLGASAYVYDPIGTPGLTIEVYIWGQVQRPGLYIVPDNTNVLSLMSLAGGPAENAKLSNVRLVRSNPETGQQQVIYIDIEEYLKTGDKSLIPVMMPGDTIVVSGTVFKAFSQAVVFISGIATVAAAYFLIFEPNRN